MLRLPPYHCIFNPIENIWGIAKTYYNKHIGEEGYGEKNAVKMWQKALDCITAGMWANTVKHTNKEILKWWGKEARMDQDRQLIINITVDSSSSENETDDSDT